MNETGPLTLGDVREAFSEVVRFHRKMMFARERPLEHQIDGARGYQSSLNDYVRVLSVAELQAELEQTQRILASWRNSVPDPFEDDEGGPG